MSRMVERDDLFYVVDRKFCCEQCRAEKNGYPSSLGKGLISGGTILCAPPLGWTVKDDPSRFFCSIQCVDEYDAAKVSS